MTTACALMHVYHTQYHEGVLSRLAKKLGNGIPGR